MRKRLLHSIETSATNLAANGSKSYDHTSKLGAYHSVDVIDVDSYLSIAHNKTTLIDRLDSHKRGITTTIKRSLGVKALVSSHKKETPSGLFGVLLEPELDKNAIEGVIEELPIIKLAKVALRMKRSSRIAKKAVKT